MKIFVALSYSVALNPPDVRKELISNILMPREADVSKLKVWQGKAFDPQSRKDVRAIYFSFELPMIPTTLRTPVEFFLYKAKDGKIVLESVTLPYGTRAVSVHEAIRYLSYKLPNFRLQSRYGMESDSSSAVQATRFITLQELRDAIPNSFRKAIGIASLKITSKNVKLHGRSYVRYSMLIPSEKSGEIPFSVFMSPKGFKTEVTDGVSFNVSKDSIKEAIDYVADKIKQLQAM